MPKKLFNARHAWTALAASSLCQVRERDASSVASSLLTLTRGELSIVYDLEHGDWWDLRDPSYVQGGFLRACRYLNVPPESAVAATIGAPR